LHNENQHQQKKSFLFHNENYTRPWKDCLFIDGWL